MSGPAPRRLVAGAALEAGEGALRPAVRCAALLVSWGNAWLAGAVPASQVGERLGAEAEAHSLDWPSLPAPVEAGSDAGLLTGLLASWRAEGAQRLVLACPGPGDPSGVGEPAELANTAMAAGAAVLVTGPHPGPSRALVPTVTAHGNPTEGHVLTVCWQGFELDPPAAPPSLGIGLAQASADLATAVAAAASELARLDVARWNPAVGEALELLREGARQARSPLPLPTWYPARAQMLLDLSVRLLVVVRLARVDDGAAVSAPAARDRDAALRAVAAAARQALLAAVNANPRADPLD